MGKHNLTRKQKAFADKLIENPTMSQAEAARQVYDIQSENTSAATALASKTAHLPAVLDYITKNAPYAEKAIVKVMKNAQKQKDNSNWQRLALDSASTVLDRAYGKSTQRIEQFNTSVNLSLSLKDVTSHND